MSDIDLGFNPNEARDRRGRWVKGGMVRTMLGDVEPGARFTTKAGSTFEKNNLGDWKDSQGSSLSGFPDGFLQTLDDLKISHDQAMDAKDRARLARGQVAGAKAKKPSFFGPSVKDSSYVPPTRNQAARMRRKIRAWAGDLSNEQDAVDLAMPGGAPRRKKGVVAPHVTPKAQAKVMRRQV